ncbi:ribonuclease III [soil metagenome]
MSDSGGALAALERRIGYRFNDRKLLVTALTHRSAAASGGHNERLEFLGDRVLALVVAEMLVRALPGSREGDMSSRFNELVRAETCADIAREIDLPDALITSGLSSPADVRRKNILGDACEALIAAVYLDGGLEPSRQFIEAHWRHRMLDWQGAHKDAKTALQEWAQARGHGMPAYTIVGKSGPEHALKFTIAVTVGTLSEGRGEGNSRREAEQAAASAVLTREGTWPKR